MICIVVRLALLSPSSLSQSHSLQQQVNSKSSECLYKAGTPVAYRFSYFTGLFEYFLIELC